MNNRAERDKGQTLAPRAVLVGIGLLAALGACTGDYDQFAFEGISSGANGGTAGNGADGGSGNGTSNGGAGAGGPGGSTGDGGAGNLPNGGQGGVGNLGGQGGVGNLGGQGGMGGQPGALIDCDGDMCDVLAGEECCINGGTATCKNNCQGNEVSVACDEDADCGVGSVCCAELKMGDADVVECRATCVGIDEALVCDPNDGSNCGGLTCTTVDPLPVAEYGVCL